MPQLVSIHYPGQFTPTDVDVYRAAQDARMYRLAARDLRRAARETDDWDRRETLTDKARRMERNARACERAVVRYADSIVSPRDGQSVH